jgi:hypothetical protein
MVKTIKVQEEAPRAGIKKAGRSVVGRGGQILNLSHYILP